MVTLTATPGTGSSFAGWSGSCSGTGACTVTMTAARNVTAAFTVNNFTLTVAPTGNGAGTITGTGINCGADCTQPFVFNTMVTLTTTPAVSSTFTGWSGACSGTGTCTCTVTMDMARSVSATFTLKLVTLTVTWLGTGVGSVDGTGIAGISYAPDCTQTVNYGTTIPLAATPSTADATASKFSGWSGACSGTTGCSVTLVADATVTADFTLRPNYMFVTSSVHSGDLGGLAGADAICKARATAANLPGNYVAYLSIIILDLNSVTLVNAPSRVGAAKGWIRVDGQPVMNSITEFAAGTLFNAPSRTEGNVDVSQTQVSSTWTGTNSNGTYLSACSTDWVSTSGDAAFGLATSTTSTAVNAATAPCSSMNRLYGMGVDRIAVAQ